MIRTTRWSPDTCGCVIEYEWDDTLPQEARKHDFKNVITRCSEHSGLGKDKAHFDHVLSENQAKNRVFAEALKNPKLGKIQKNDNNEDFTVLADGVKFEWSFVGKDGDRKLSVAFPGSSLTAAEKSALTAIPGVSKQVESK